MCSTPTGQAMWCIALDWLGGPGHSFPSPSLRSRARPPDRSRMSSLSAADVLRAVSGAMPPWTTVGYKHSAEQNVSIPSRPPAVGSQARGEHAALALPDAGTGVAGFSLSGRVLSLSLAISSDISVASISIYDNTRGKPRDEHGHTRVPYMKRYTLNTDKSEFMQPKVYRSRYWSGGPIVSTRLTRICLIRVRPRAQAGYSPTSPPPALAQGILLQARAGSRTQDVQAGGITVRRTDYMLYMKLRRASTSRR